MRENPIKMDDLGVPQFLETPIFEKLKFFNGLSLLLLAGSLEFELLNLRPAALLGDAMKGLKFFHFPQSWRDDIRPTFQDFKKLSIRCGATKIHRFQQPQVRVPAPTANRPRCRWDPFFFCWKIGIQKLGKRQSPSKPIFLVSILGFLCVFLIENRYPRESARGETRGIVCTCTSCTSPTWNFCRFQFEV